MPGANRNHTMHLRVIAHLFVQLTRLKKKGRIDQENHGQDIKKLEQADEQTHFEYRNMHHLSEPKKAALPFLECMSIIRDVDESIQCPDITQENIRIN